MRGQAKIWGVPTTLTIVYKPSKRQWFASFTVELEPQKAFLGSDSELKYESIVAFDLGTATAITCFDGKNFEEVSNPRFTQVARDKGSCLVMYNVALNQQQGLGTNLSSVDVFSSTSLTSKRKHTGSMKQLEQLKRLKS